MENHLKYKYLLLLVVLSDAKIGLTHGKDLALGEETMLNTRTESNIDAMCVNIKLVKNKLNNTLLLIEKDHFQLIVLLVLYFAAACVLLSCTR